MLRKPILYLIFFLLILGGMMLLRFDPATNLKKAADSDSGSGQVYADPQPEALKTVKTAAIGTSDATDSPSQQESPDFTPTDRFEQKVNRWISALADQTVFSEWKNAQWTRYPLGPGKHGWIVILSKHGKDVGYLVVIASQSGDELVLSEYGVGEYPLFSMSTLYASLNERQLISASMTLKQFASDTRIQKTRLYLNPLHTVWLVPLENDITNDRETYLDAKTGEIYPLTKTEVKASTGEIPALTFSPQQERISESISLPSFDPYTLLNWVKDKPMNIQDWNDLKQKLDQQVKITFAAEIFGKHILIPYAVTGYHQWNEGEPYVQLEQEGARFIPFHSIARWGAFFQRP